jgi:biopolymer transport protein ExbB
MEDLAAFTNDLHGYLMSGGAVKPRVAAATGSSASSSASARAASAPSEPVRTPTTAK